MAETLTRLEQAMVSRSICEAQQAVQKYLRLGSRMSWVRVREPSLWERVCASGGYIKARRRAALEQQLQDLGYVISDESSPSTIWFSYDHLVTEFEKQQQHAK